jgi:hypothetical protein
MRIVPRGAVVAAVATAISLTTEYAWAAGWTIQSSPSPGTNDELWGAAVTSVTNAWAVGQDFDQTSQLFEGLILHEDGADWTTQATVTGTGGVIFRGVKATGSANAWAVGWSHASTPNGTKTFIEHWDGTAWTTQTSPNPSSSFNQLFGIAANGSEAWGVGTFQNASLTPRTLIVHWDGSQWTQQTSQNLSSNNNQLTGASATSNSDVWAVGFGFNGSGNLRTLIEHWNGTTWAIVSSPNPGTSNNLNGVKATSATNAWAVGEQLDASGNSTPLVLHWDGTSWKVQAAAVTGDPTDFLNGVAANSSSNAFTVGLTAADGPSSDQTLIEHCC